MGDDEQVKEWAPKEAVEYRNHVYWVTHSIPYGQTWFITIEDWVEQGIRYEWEYFHRAGHEE